ncbi:hypothetical protein K2X33_11230 [bacterium]|nr:hypothetical protein [bacterium]
MRIRALALAALFSMPAWGTESLSLDARYLAVGSRPDEVLETLGYHWQEESWEFFGGTRIAHSLSAQSWEVFAAGLYSPLSWVSLEGRFNHRNRLQEASASSFLFGALHLEGEWFGLVRPFFSLGYYYRRHLVGQNSLLPILFGPSFTEHNFAFALGLGIVVSPAWEIRTQLATIEKVDVLYPNNPFVEVRGTYTPGKEWRAALYARYQSLLGFGLPEAWVGGASFEYSLGDGF